MENKVKFNSQTLLDIVFEKDVKGYNPLQVDETLDEIIFDYKIYEEKDNKNTAEISLLKKEVESLKEKLRESELEIAKSKNTVQRLPSDVNVSTDNVALLKRIDALERALYQKGVDPKKI